jgi:hypothetical protein
MYSLLVKLMMISAVSQLGLSLISIYEYRPTDCAKLEQFSQQITQIDWKPISIFPKESKRFR